MEKLIVNKSGVIYGYDGGSATTVADLTDVATLADGAIGLFTPAGVLCLAATGTATYDSLGVYQGSSEAGPIFMGTLYPRRFSFYKSAVYAAAATKIAGLGNNVADETTYDLFLPATLTVGTVAGIQLIDKSKRHEDNSRYHNYEAQVVTGDTHTTLMARLLAKITADTNKPIASVAAIALSGVTNGVLATGKTLVDFSMIGTGILANADQLEYKDIIKSNHLTEGYTSGLTGGVVAYSAGNTTTANMLALEKATNPGLGENGHLTSRENDLFTLSSRLVAGVNYLTYYVQCMAPNTNGGLVDADNFLNTFIFVVDGDDSALITILDAIFAILVAQSY